MKNNMVGNKNSKHLIFLTHDPHCYGCISIWQKWVAECSHSLCRATNFPGEAIIAGSAGKNDNRQVAGNTQCLSRGTISNFLKMIFFILFHILDLKGICFCNYRRQRAGNNDNRQVTGDRASALLREGGLAILRNILINFNASQPFVSNK